MKILSEHACFGGVQGFYAHPRAGARAKSTFRLSSPQPGFRRLPVLAYLAGLTCTERRSPPERGRRLAAELGIVLVRPIRAHARPGWRCVAHWDFGLGAGFYVDAAPAPWSGTIDVPLCQRELARLHRQGLSPRFRVRRHFRALMVGIARWSRIPIPGVTQVLVSAFAPVCAGLAMPLGREGARRLSRPGSSELAQLRRGRARSLGTLRRHPPGRSGPRRQIPGRSVKARAPARGLPRERHAPRAAAPTTSTTTAILHRHVRR